MLFLPERDKIATAQRRKERRTELIVRTRLFRPKADRMAAIPGGSAARTRLGHPSLLFSSGSDTLLTLLSTPGIGAPGCREDALNAEGHLCSASRKVAEASSFKSSGAGCSGHKIASAARSSPRVGFSHPPADRVRP